jgi:DNA mismatch endonuclease (patch repair protein)
VATDSLTSRRMASVRRCHTAPEIAVQSVLDRMGVAYDTHASELPGSPDIVLRSRRIAIFVHGCFWHRHSCSRASEPRVHVAYWRRKFIRTVARDRAAMRALRAAQWHVTVVWECQAKLDQSLERVLRRLLDRTAAKVAGRGWRKAGRAGR